MQTGIAGIGPVRIEQIIPNFRLKSKNSTVLFLLFRDRR